MDSYFNTELKKIISKFQKFNDAELEFHFQFKNIEKIVFEKIFNNLNKNYSFYSITLEVNILYENLEDRYSTFRVTKQFKNGVNLNDDIIILKKTLNKPLNFKTDVDNILGISLHLKDERSKYKLPPSSKISMINIKLRVSFSIKELPNWRYDLDLLKTVRIEDNNLKEYKNKILFPITIDNYLNKLPYNFIDKLSLEIEYIGDKDKLSTDNINDPINYLYNIITPNYKNKVEYQNYIYKIATLIIKNKYLLNQFKTKSGFKRLSNNVVELNYVLYYDQIIPNITNYYLTDKIDGQRGMLYITKKGDKMEVKIVSDKLYSVQDNTLFQDLNEIDETTILDIEFIYNGEKDSILELKHLDIYVFDIILFNNTNLAYEPFEKRFELFGDVSKFLTKNNLGMIKSFIKLTKNYKKEIKDFYTKSLKQKYETDGLIFTPSSNIKNDKNSINQTYSDMLGYKWKPEDKITIDFYIAKSLDKNKNDYILCSGINKKDYEKLQIQLISNYYKIIPKKYHNNQYFPIAFTPSNSPLIYKYVYDGKDNLTGKVGEFLYDTKNNKWNLIKIRTDRDIEVERGEYFGNAFKYAELNWHNIQNPLSINDLVSDKSNDYFFSKSGDQYKPQRNFNSFVKTKILEAIVDDKLIDRNNKNWIIDLASGKGQDLARITDLGFKNGIFVDNDSNALFNLIERKHNLKLRTKNKMNIYVKNIDLSIAFTKIIKQFEDIPFSSADVIVCNFAIHYLTNIDKNIKNLLTLVYKLLRDNGRFLFTCFNGERVFKLLEDTSQWNVKENNILKYSIKKKYKSNLLSSVGQQISVLLPFSNNEYYDEYLVNLEYIFNTAEKVGLLLEMSNSFETMLDKFSDDNKEIYNKLTDNDKEFVSLYQYNILKKTKTKKNNNLVEVLQLNKNEIQGKSESNIMLPITFINNCEETQNVVFIIPVQETEENTQEKKLSYVINNIHKYMKDSLIEYKIYIIEQLHGVEYNLNMMYNIGFELLQDKNIESICFIDLNSTYINNNLQYFTKSCNNPILLDRDWVFQKNKFSLINGFSNKDDDIANRLNYYKIPIITNNINIIINKEVNYDDIFKLDGLNSLDYNILEKIEKNNITRFIIDININ